MTPAAGSSASARSASAPLAPSAAEPAVDPRRPAGKGKPTPRRRDQERARGMRQAWLEAGLAEEYTEDERAQIIAAAALLERLLAR